MVKKRQSWVVICVVKKRQFLVVIRMITKGQFWLGWYGMVWYGNFI